MAQSRRETIFGIAAGGVGAAALLVGGGAVVGASDAHAEAVAEPAVALPVAPIGTDLVAFAAANLAFQLVPNARYFVSSPIKLRSNSRIEGNGANIITNQTAYAAIEITQVSTIALRGIRFVGQWAYAAGQTMVTSHVGVKITRGTLISITDCNFVNWRGAGISVQGSGGDNYLAYRHQIHGNAFEACYFAVSITDRAEYGSLAANTFVSCRLAMWVTSGNWNIANNVIVDCYGGYYSIAATSPFGAQSSDNWNHGSFTGNTINHSNGGGRNNWSANAAFPIGGVMANPGAGVVIEGLIPPTFTGNSLWYSNIRVTNHAANRFVLTGCTLSNLSVSATGNPVVIIGDMANNGAAATLSGNVTRV